jgi:hypothetical protein
MNERKAPASSNVHHGTSDAFVGMKENKPMEEQEKKTLLLLVTCVASFANEGCTRLSLPPHC